ncbi:MAG: hypothetical protein ACUVRC_06220 [Desulfotomaculales bacterium]
MPHHIQMSEMERLQMMEVLRVENHCAKKFPPTWTRCRTPEIRSLLQQLSNKGQQHINALSGIMRDAGMSPPPTFS